MHVVHNLLFRAVLEAQLDLAFQVGSNLCAHLGKIAVRNAKALGERLVDLRQVRCGHLLHGDLEAGGLSGYFLAVIVIGKAQLERLLSATAHAGEVAFKIRQQTPLSQHRLHVLAPVSGKFLPAKGRTPRSWG